MSELELKITVRTSSGNIGEQVRGLFTDGEDEGITLESSGYSLNVVKLERADGLPLAIEEDFSDWFSKSGIQSMHRQILYKAYIAGRMAK